MDSSKTEAFIGISGCLDELAAHRPISGYTPFDIPIAITLDQQRKITSVTISLNF